MLKGLLLCAAACAAPTTVLAGDKDLPIVPNLKAMLAADGAARNAPGRKAAMARPASFVPIAYRGLERADLSTTTVSQPPVRLQSATSVAELKAARDWHLSVVENSQNTTSARGGSWAVYDTLSDHRKPRFRRSALSTMLVLKIDGKENTSPVSVGGGGVASALWKAMPGD
ncbi:hypothetical protein [Sphingomonas sp. NIBR02145]|uniref:hypothetical protein n=1 Tax=Sphingomonas sp. NIBR02145 TaxID=3014784 RepID=UPI0022B36651|nr:hypothetical protein [Sphingomonas sp. NIBR02145]WHU03979.1 hypothetical protein O3305_05135 [Sphingomonas sp. NIBR02145]|eukprot:TRINITY_DN8240_c0_g1_i1.p2 TRINITY_DN8240_c0_g1~~TRINITY_DN8240_c0_g1_i1.p2  ORF type:complete len:171 (+),score=23.15 TRINITY_DN8240_c0_g1_i1:104-616(+)